MGRGPRVFSTGLPQYDEMDDKYLNPESQIKRIPQQFFYSSSPFIKDYNEVDIKKLTPDEKMNMILEIVTRMNNDFNNMLMLIMILIMIILLKLIKR